MATETMKKIALQYQLENGRGDDGTMKYKNQTLQYTSAAGYDADKYIAVIAALEPCLNKVLGGANAIKTYVVTAS